MDVLRPLSTGVSMTGGLVRGSRAVPNPRHPATRYASTPGIHPIIPHQNNKHAFHAKPTSFCSHRIPRIHQDRRAKDARQWRDLFDGGSLRWKEKGGEPGGIQGDLVKCY